MSASFKVYVVDDDPVVLDIMHAILEPDCQVETFPSAEDCLMQLESEKPDFFLLDVNLPGMDGYTLCRQIKDNPALRSIPVTFVSSNDTIEERITGYDAGGEDFIVAADRRFGWRHQLAGGGDGGTLFVAAAVPDW